MRAELLRSEQDNELMRIKLEQETAEREKAQKQVRRQLTICLVAALDQQESVVCSKCHASKFASSLRHNASTKPGKEAQCLHAGCTAHTAMQIFSCAG